MISSALNSTNYLLILCGFLVISFINRILDKTESLQPNDSASDPHYQLCTAILAREQKTLCPEQRSYGDTRGRYFYPLGSFWYPSKLLVAFPFIKNIVYNKDNSLSKSLNSNSNDIDNYIVFLKIINGILLPLITQIQCILYFYYFLPHSIYTLTSSIACLAIIDSVYFNCTNSISTRNQGYFLYSNFVFSCLCYSNISLVSTFDQQILLGYLIISFLATSFFIFQVSQRYSQAFICFSLSLSIVKPDTAFLFLLLFILAIFILINLQYTNFTAYIKTHFYNRVHDFQWSQKVYGYRRYGLFNRLRDNDFREFIKCALCFKFIYSGFGFGAFYKKNLVSLFLVFRIYLYAVLLLNTAVFANYDYPFDYYHILLALVLACSIPALLCFFNPFQGYGASEVYFFAGLLGTTIAFTQFSSSIDFGNSTLINSILRLFFIENICFIIAYLAKLAKIRYSLNTPLISLGDNFSPVVLSGANKNIFKVYNTLSRLLVSYNSSNALTIVAPEMHLFSTADLFSRFINQQTGKHLLINTFKQIDSKDYSWYQDLFVFTIHPSIVFNKIKPDLILLDKSRPSTKLYLESVRSNKTVLTMKFDNIIILSFAPSFNKFLQQKSRQ